MRRWRGWCPFVPDNSELWAIGPDKNFWRMAIPDFRRLPGAVVDLGAIRLPEPNPLLSIVVEDGKGRPLSHARVLLSLDGADRQVDGAGNALIETGGEGEIRTRFLVAGQHYEANNLDFPTGGTAHFVAREGMAVRLEQK